MQGRLVGEFGPQRGGVSVHRDLGVLEGADNGRDCWASEGDLVGSRSHRCSVIDLWGDVVRILPSLLDRHRDVVSPKRVR
jgi:hypothetical protein